MDIDDLINAFVILTLTAGMVAVIWGLMFLGPTVGHPVVDIVLQFIVGAIGGLLLAGVPIGVLLLCWSAVREHHNK